MKNQNDVYKLSNGVGVPCIGFGTWQTPEGDVAVSSVEHAIKAGYRHIDTAQVYGNEEGVGKGIRIGIIDEGLTREDIFVTTKIWNDKHSYDLCKSSFDESLRKLGLDYVDMLLIHWPNPAAFRDRWEEANAETWRAMEELYESGKVRSIGISNFRQHHIEALLKTAKIKPMVNQIRLCPGATQDELVAYCKEQGMILEAYSPLGTGQIFDVPEMKKLAEKYGKSIAQICVRFSLQMGFLPLPKSVHADRIKENLDVFDFELEAGDVKLIADLKGCVGYESDPDTRPF
ncbi:aldo/keto reductase [Butyrivibrio sp. XB500-5]|uniref:aldo/keto reductase n=1 Tax=Butyrivibrio sp. XB500-5 TaxID=2364880 RepID=UPI000EA86B0E|nr:aldo/keto reductase [Butyrivibrio sp. XB500-5]RKM63118.1 aldo/keto reductase [Butyrivibrio sp. XB500-5]